MILQPNRAFSKLGTYRLLAGSHQRNIDYFISSGPLPTIPHFNDGVSSFPRGQQNWACEQRLDILTDSRLLFPYLACKFQKIVLYELSLTITGLQLQYTPLTNLKL